MSTDKRIYYKTDRIDQIISYQKNPYNGEHYNEVIIPQSVVCCILNDLTFERDTLKKKMGVDEND